MTDERAVEIERRISDASPDAVFAALTEAEQLRRWFPLDARVEPGPSGSVWLSWGPGCEGEAPIRAWEPGRRFGWVERSGSPEAPVELAVDFHLHPEGAGTVVRLVHSGFGPGADWDDYYDAVRDGWTYFLYSLEHYVRHHAGTPRRPAWVRRRAGRERKAVWTDLVGDAGPVTLPGPEPLPDDRVRVDLGPAGSVEGTVVHARTDHCLAVRLEELGESLLFVELEAGGGGWHCGIWLSTWGLPVERVQTLQSAVDGWAAHLLP